MKNTVEYKPNIILPRNLDKIVNKIKTNKKELFKNENKIKYNNKDHIKIEKNRIKEILEKYDILDNE